MNIEIIEFYPSSDKKRKEIGSLHIYLPDLKLDIRGISVFKNAKHWFFQIPYRFGEEFTEEGRQVQYPIVCFNSPDMEKDFRATVIEKGRAFVEEWLKHNPLPPKLVIPRPPKKEFKKPYQQKPYAKKPFEKKPYEKRPYEQKSFAPRAPKPINPLQYKSLTPKY